MKMRSELTTIRIPKKLRNTLKALAARRGLFVYQLLAQLVLKELGDLENL